MAYKGKIKNIAEDSAEPSAGTYADRLRGEADTRLKEYLAAAERRRDAASASHDGGSGQALDGEVRPGFQGSGLHFSREQRAILDGRFFGADIRGTG